MILIKRLYVFYLFLLVLCILLNCEVFGLWLGFIYVVMDMWFSFLFSFIILVVFFCSVLVLEFVILFFDFELFLILLDGVGFLLDLFGVLGFFVLNIVDLTRILVDFSLICKKKW